MRFFIVMAVLLAALFVPSVASAQQGWPDKGYTFDLAIVNNIMWCDHHNRIGVSCSRAIVPPTSGRRTSIYIARNRRIRVWRWTQEIGGVQLVVNECDDKAKLQAWFKRRYVWVSGRKVEREGKDQLEVIDLEARATQIPIPPLRPPVPPGRIPVPC